MKKIFLTMALAIGLMANAQVKIGANPTNINAASILEIESTTQGVLFPRVALVNTTTATLAGGLHVQGMTVYNTATEGDVTPGMYTSDGAKWVKLGGSSTPAYQNIVGGVQFLSTNGGTISDDTYLLTYSGAAATLTLPSLIPGKTFYVRNIGTGAATVAGVLVNVGKSRVFVCNGIEWFIMLP